MWGSDSIKIDRFDGTEKALLFQDADEDMNLATSRINVEVVSPNAISRNQTP